MATTLNAGETPGRWVRTILLWMLAAMFAIVFNMALLCLMSGLLDDDFIKPEYAEYVEAVNVIRIKRTEQPARRKEKKPEARPREIRRRRIREKPVYANLPVKNTIDIPFEVNPKLTPIPRTIPMVPMRTAGLGKLALKHSYGVGEIDNRLKPLVQAPPIYPMVARRRGIEGWVKVQFIVDEKGRTQTIRILKSDPKRIFDKAVIRCVSGWRFSPGTVEGVPVKTRVETTIRFNLE